MTPVEDLAGLLRHHTGKVALRPAVGILVGPVHVGQLNEALGCFWIIDHPGLDHPGAKTVVADCHQDHLDAVLAAYEYDPLHDAHRLVRKVAAGERLDEDEIQEALALLLLKES